MQHFRNTSGEVFAFEDDVTTEWVDENTQGLTPITEDQARALLCPAGSDVLTEAKAARGACLRKECETAIMGGFSSNALVTGRAFYYDSDRDDQQNLSDAITALEVNGGTFAIVCNDPDTQDGFIERDHTEAQAKKVKADFAVYRLGRSQHLTTKLGEVALATTVEAVNSVNW